MTVSSETSSGTFAWTGVETSFAPGFKAQAVSHVRAKFTNSGGVQSDLINGVHFTATLDGGNNVTFLPLALPPAPGTVLIYRQTPALQETDFQNLGSYDPSVHTRLHDAAALRDAELAAEIVRALRPVNGWSPIPALVADGVRVVFQIVAWAGGEGTPPASGQYIGAAGLVAAIGDATNVRGTAGAGTGDVVGPAGGTLAMQFAFYGDATGKLIREGLALAPAQLTASVSDYNPSGLSTAFLVRLSANNPWSLTGLAGGAALRPLILANTSAPLITLANENAGSAAANRFAFGGNIELAEHELVFLVYDAPASRWRRAGGGLANAAVKSRHVGAGEIGNAHIAPASITVDKIAAAIAASVNGFNFGCFR